jgi:hypothetical protein
VSNRSTGGLDRWFGEVSLRSDLDLSATSFLAELTTMLGSLRPALMDTARSTVRQSERDLGVEIEIAHQVDPDASISGILGDEGGIIFWLSAHEHLFPDEAPVDRGWTTVAVDAIAEILCGEYVVEDHYRGKRLLKTQIINVADPSKEHVMETIGTPFALIPWPGPKRVERRRIDFGAHRPSTTNDD